MGQHDHQEEEVLCDVTSEESLSRSNSVEQLSVQPLGDGRVEERFRVDRKKLELMILGRRPQQSDADMILPLTLDGRVMTADSFFRKIMDKTETEIRYPRFLKAGARSKRDPHVRIIGSTDAVRIAGNMVRQELEPPNKVTMKMDVPWPYHSHIIGRGGTTIQPVVKRTGVCIHFPDGNKTNEMRKSNQVSINCKGEDLQGMEEARRAIRNLTPLVFTFTILPSVQFCSYVDATMLILHVQSLYNVQVDLQMQDGMKLVGEVRGTEMEAQTVMQATKYVIQAYCSRLASQVPTQVALVVSPQHHAFILGRNNEQLKRIMQQTSTKITFPDWSNMSLSLLERSTINVSGSIENVHWACQNIIGSLPLVLLFDLMPGTAVDMAEVAKMMEVLDLQIVLKTCRADGRRPVVVKGPERKAQNVYQAWRMICKVDAPVPTVLVPSSYCIGDCPSHNGAGPHSLGVGGWVGSSSESSPMPSPASTPTPPAPHFPTSLWGCLNTAPAPLLPHLTRLDPVSPTPAYFNGNPFVNGCCPIADQPCGGGVLPPGPGCISSDGCGTWDTTNLNSFVRSLKAINSMTDISCGTSTSSSRNTSPSHSPADSSPDNTLLPPPTSFASSPAPSTTAAAAAAALFPQNATETSTEMDALSALLKEIDWRAPGCEKNYIERVTAQKMTLSDYTSKKMEAAKAMKQDVGSNPRTPTSNWSGYYFSKSMPSKIIKQRMQEAQEGMQQNEVGGSGLDEWGDTWTRGDGTTPITSSPVTTTTTLPTTTPSTQASRPLGSLKYNTMTQYTFSGAKDGILGTPSVRPSINLSASNFMDCVLPRRDRDTLPASTLRNLSSSSKHQNITSILNDIQLPQYIDVFLGQEVDLNMFMSLEDYDLKELGISIFGHRKRILMAIKDLSSKSSLFSSSTSGGGGGGGGGLGSGGSSRANLHHHHT